MHFVSEIIHKLQRIQKTKTEALQKPMVINILLDLNLIYKDQK